MSTTQAEWIAFLATLPPATREIAERYPGIRDGELVCYRSSESPRMHYTLYSYSNDLTVTLVHGDDSTLPGVRTFGQPPEQLIPCDCGKWAWPTVENSRRTLAHLDSRLGKRRGST